MESIMIEDIILTKKKFTLMVENIVLELRLNYMDAIIKVCEDRGLDPSDVGKLISPAIKDKLQAECVTLKLVSGDDNSTQLPV
jgi:hypothetical protein